MTNVLNNKHAQKRTLFYMILIGVVLWCTESALHMVFFTEKSIWGAIYLEVPTDELYLRFFATLTGCMLYLLSVKNDIIKETEKQLENILNGVIPICITNTNFEIIMANETYWHIWGKPASDPIKCYQHRPGKHCHTEKCALTQILDGTKEYICESQKEQDGENHYFIVTARPFMDANNNVIGVIESLQDITERTKLENERLILIEQLQSTLEQVKLLGGLLPICASCKKIRDDKGYWNQIEGYIRDHSEAQFSHGICPECAKKLYPEFNFPNKSDHNSP